MWGNPLQNFGCSLQLVKLIQYKKISVREPLAKSQLLYSVVLSSLDFIGRRIAALKIYIARWGNALQNSGCSLQLVELIPHQPKRLNIKKSSVGEPLAKFRLLSSVVPPLLDCLRRPRADSWIMFL